MLLDASTLINPVLFSGRRNTHCSVARKNPAIAYELYETKARKGPPSVSSSHQIPIRHTEYGNWHPACQAEFFWILEKKVEDEAKHRHR